jgi:hypothetical protein
MIADNGSTDSTVKILQRLARIDPRVRWIDASGPWNPSPMLTDLTREFHRRGIEWVIPCDADEFLFWGGTHVRDLCFSSRAGGIRLNVCNFVQWTWFKRSRSSALEAMIFSCHPVGSPSDAKALVESKETAFLQTRAYSPKVIIRTSNSVLLHRGHHSSEGISGEWEKCLGAEVLHAPIVARDRMDARVVAAHRLAQVESSPDIGWHLRYFAKQEKQKLLDEEWRANSTLAGLIGHPGKRRFLRLDLRLRHIAMRQRGFVTRVCSDTDSTRGCRAGMAQLAG